MKGGCSQDWPRYRMKDVLRAIERGESVTVLHRGTAKARITPVSKADGPKPSSDKAFGMWKDRKDLADPAGYGFCERTRRPGV